MAAMVGGNIPDANVLILPSIEGAEIPILLSFGFREDHIHAVDSNPALVATAPWRKAFPHVQYYGNELARAGVRIAAKGVRLAAANLDLCGCYSRKMMDSLRGFAESGALDDLAVIGLTMLRGREQSSVVDLLRELNSLRGRDALDCDLRLDAALHELTKQDDRLISLCGSGEYRSQTQQMAWACAATATLGAVDRERQARAAKVARAVDRLWSHLEEQDALRRSFSGNGRFTRSLYAVSAWENRRDTPWMSPDRLSENKRAADAYYAAERRLKRLNALVPALSNRVRIDPSSSMPFPRRWSRRYPYSMTAMQHFENDIAQYADGPLPFSEWMVSRRAEPNSVRKAA